MNSTLHVKTRDESYEKNSNRGNDRSNSKNGKKQI